ncbi:flavonol synthase/flavanone 3-hydroxylase-like [Vicia villosa]|uniref:flavonol synthase/flavanone 3-hydroxylase-like n=1 Tax=Vicia villosa TaxID=3911 RepID=UPI00273C8AE3|nr:flavonol synthase/flavanone 3-hydroxylase-like [Vicia villosa]
MTDVYSSYILSTENRPNFSTFVEVDKIPIIDLSQTSQENLISEIRKACEEWGFFHVINHGVPSDLINKVANETKKIFGLSMEEKKKLRRDAINATGYHDAEHTNLTRDWKEVYDCLIYDGIQVPCTDDPNDSDLWTLTNHWPQSLPHFRETMKEYGGEVEKLSFKLLELISLSLGLAGDKFFDCHKNQLSLVRLNYYPPCPFPDMALGIGPHKDPCVLTILAQDDTGGLQVKKNSVGGWVNIKPVPGALVVNLGDVFQVWSNDKYDSAVHRAVVSSEKERYSYPFFFFPGHHVMVQPAEELVSEKNPAKYKPYNFGKYYANRTHHDFNKEEVAGKEIYDFKTSD